MKVALTNGCFDLPLHVGHLNMLQVCRNLAGGDGMVVVGINTDESVKRLKGEHRPIIPLAFRYRIIQALRCVDRVIAFDTEEELIQLVADWQPRYYVQGKENREQTITRQMLDQWGGVYRFVPIVASTSELIRKIRELPE